MEYRNKGNISKLLEFLKNKYNLSVKCDDDKMGNLFEKSELKLINDLTCKLEKKEKLLSNI